jgi:hypothetical protein
MPVIRAKKKKRKEAMRQLFVTMCASAFVVTGASAQQAAQMTGAELREAIAGRTVYLASPLGEVQIRYAKNGTMHSSTQLALLDGERTTTDRGRWWVTDNQLCLRWQNWMGSRPYCFTMYKAGNRVHWRRNDGKSGMARLG